MLSAKPRVPIQNRILSALPTKKYKDLLSNLQPVSLNLSQVLYDAGDPVRYVYFPNNAMISLVAIREDGGRSVEVGVVGEEGMLGTSAFLGNPVAHNKALVQLAGSALRVRVDVLREAVEGGGRLHTLLHGYTQVVLTQITRSAVCNRFHNLRERLARWLLITHDHAKSDTFPMTHEFMSHLLGARRVDVTKSATALQKAKLVSYHRGKVTVVDRQGLEEASCNCYRIVRDEIARLHTEEKP
jgi:CRP-like cAMP-binding protein